MKKVLLFVFAASLAFQLVAGPALAKPTVFTVDPNHSRVSFSIRHIFSKVPGNFTLKEGTLTYDAEAPAGGSVRAEIDASSISTANAKRDGHLKSADFFDVEKYPTITFVSKEVKDLGQGKLQVIGDLTMHGVTKRVTLDASYLGSGPGPGGEIRAGFEATTRLNRKDFEILWNRALDQGGTLLGDDVDIRLDIEGIERGAAEAKGGATPSKPADAKPAVGKPAEKASK